jgi:hypothetical protein
MRLSFQPKLAPTKAGAGIQAGPFAWTPAFAGVTSEFLASETGSTGQDTLGRASS